MAFKCLLVTPISRVVDAEVWQVALPATTGKFCIRTGHVPIIAALESGIVEIALSEKERSRYSITSGIVEYHNNQCTIMCDNVKVEE